MRHIEKDLFVVGRNIRQLVRLGGRFKPILLRHGVNGGHRRHSSFGLSPPRLRFHHRCFVRHQVPSTLLFCIFIGLFLQDPQIF